MLFLFEYIIHPTGMVLVCQAMVFSVAINSKKRALTALLIAANFVEIKGTIFKRYDAHKLLTLTRQDVVERFHLLLTLAFVVCEDAQDGLSPARLWALLRCASAFVKPFLHRPPRHCGAIYGSEVIIDVIKHAILGKLNDLRPGMYREFMRDTCEQVRKTCMIIRRHMLVYSLCRNRALGVTRWSGCCRFPQRRWCCGCCGVVPRAPAAGYTGQQGAVLSRGTLGVYVVDAGGWGWRCCMRCCWCSCTGLPRATCLNSSSERRVRDSAADITYH